MNVKEEVVDDDIVVKDEQFHDSVTVPLSCMLQQPTITQRCLKKDSGNETECPCEECTGSVWIQGEGGHWIKVKVEKESASVDHPTDGELQGQPGVSNPGVCLNLPADCLGSFFGDKEEEVSKNSQTTGSSTSKPPHQCSTCGKTFKKKSHCTEHEWTHDPARPRPYACTNCEKAFPSRWQLRAHEAIHREERPFVCSVCGKGFIRGSTLKAHQVVHSPEKPFHCLICGSKFNFKGSLKYHQQAHDCERSKVQCTDCGAHFLRMKNLQRHRQYNCPRRMEQTAPDSTPFQGNLQMEVSSTSSMTPEGAPFNTEELQGKRCANETLFTQVTSSSYQCSTCGKAFPDIYRLEKHELIHSDVRELFACPTCGKSYTVKFKLKEHQRLRCGKERYRCPICRRFSLSKACCTGDDLSDQSSQRMLLCTECKGPFEWSSLRIQHRQHCSILGKSLNK